MNHELSSKLADELVGRGFESPDLDYKESFDDTTGSWMELTKDVCAMSNFGGGYIVFGVKDGTFEPLGLDPSIQKDTQDWIDRISKWVTGSLLIAYLEYQKEISKKMRKFLILRINGSVGSLLIPKIEGSYVDKYGRTQVAFRQGAIYTRRATSSASITGDEFWNLFWDLQKRTAEATGSQGTPLEVLSALEAKTKPATIEEKLWFNLFPVLEIPDFIYSAFTECRYPNEVYQKVNSVYAMENTKFSTGLPF